MEVWNDWDLIKSIDPLKVRINIFNLKFYFETIGHILIIYFYPQKSIV